MLFPAAAGSMNSRLPARASAGLPDQANKNLRSFSKTNNLSSNPYSKKSKSRKPSNQPSGRNLPFTAKPPIYSTTGCTVLVPLTSKLSRARAAKQRNIVDMSAGRIRPRKSAQATSATSVLGRRARQLPKDQRTSASPALTGRTVASEPFTAIGTSAPPDATAGTNKPTAQAHLLNPGKFPTSTSISLSDGGSPRGLTGLKNLGNTCFMNSCLQCLSNVPPLVSYLFDKQMLVQINVRSSSKGDLAKSLAELYKRMWTARAYSSESPYAVKQLIGRVASRFSGYNQQDAQEFLRFLLDGLHEDLNLVQTPPPYQELDIKEHLPEMQKSCMWWENYCHRNNSAVKNLFCGQLRSQVTCCTCNNQSTAFDPFWDLSIPIPKEFQSFGRGRGWRLGSLARKSSRGGAAAEAKKCNVMDCLNAFATEEILDGNNAYYCSGCKSHKRSKKKMCVFRLPTVLVIHLKRFSFDLNRRTKLTTQIQMPLQQLDISGICWPEIVKQRKPAPYDLVAVSNHMGGCFGGHYTADCLNQTTKKWYRFNDARVSELAPSQLDEAAAYLLFYLQRPAPSKPTTPRHTHKQFSSALKTKSKI